MGGMAPMLAVPPDPERPWIVPRELYQPVDHTCPRPALGVHVQEPFDDRLVLVEWLQPGTRWACPECQLVYVVVRTDTSTAMWISFGAEA